MNTLNLQEDTRKRFGGRAGLAALVLLMLAAVLVFLYLYRQDIILALVLGRDDTEWARDIEQDNSTGHESATAVVATGNGFSVVGHTNSRQPGVEQAWVLRFDKAPPPGWEQTYAGGKLGTSGHAIASRPGGGLVIAGTAHVDGGFRAWLLALSKEGSVLWERTPGQVGVNGLNAVSVLEDGSIVAGGAQEGEGWVVRMDSRGELLWEVKLPRLEQVTALVPLPAQRIALVGKAETSTVGPGVSRLMMLESDGRATVEKQLPAEGQGELDALALLPDGGLVATGRMSRADSTGWNLWLVRLEPGGEPLWQFVVGATETEAGHGIAVFPDGGIAVVGASVRGLFEHEAKVWRFSADGLLLWEQTYGGAGNDTGYGIARLEDESLVVVGSTTSKGAGKTDLWTFGLSPEGQLLWEETFGAP